MKIAISTCKACGTGAPQLKEVMRMNIKNYYERGYMVSCMGCGAKTADYHTKKAAVDAWNEGKFV